MNGSILELKRNHVFAGRAASGIYAVLKSICRDAEVVVPANICPMGVYPVVYSGNTPVFCDVESPSGNTSLRHLKEVVTSRTAAMVIPHMYGNPVAEIALIRNYCREKGIVLIEDCASAMGASTREGPVGTFGDYAVYSTGHAKILDLGGGGLVASDSSLADAVAVLNELPEWSDEGQRQEEAFSKTYRKFLNTRRSLSEFSQRSFFDGDFRRMLLFRVEAEYPSKVREAVSRRLEEEIGRRRRTQRLFEEIFDDLLPREHRYIYESGAAPWRFSFFIPQDVRQAVADALLARSFSVSDWYPAIPELFGDLRTYPAAERLGKSILNLPLGMDMSDFSMACHVVRDTLKRNGVL